MAELEPRVFFLNERQTLEGGERPSRGKTPQFEVDDWKERVGQLALGLETIRYSARRYPKDPTSGRRFFLAATPTPRLVSPSNAKDAQDGKKSRPADFRDDDAGVLLKLGFDVLDIDESGRALCHLDETRLGVLDSQLKVLEKSGRIDQARWARLELLWPTEAGDRLDREWLDPLPREELVEFVAKLPALLSRDETEDVQRAILTMMDLRRGDRLIETGLDYSGRAWLLGKSRVKRLETIAEELAAIQVIFEPLRLVSESARPKSGGRGRANTTHSDETRATVAVVDKGIPPAHRALAGSLRAAFTLGSPSHVGDHGSQVAGVISHGYVPPGTQPQSTSCDVVDVNIANPLGSQDEGQLLDRVIEAMALVVSGAPDVRVFNISLGTKPSLRAMTEKRRREAIRLTADLDGFASEHDVVVVVAAGNSPSGLLPTKRYPNHIEDPQWAYGALAPAANAITVGAYADTYQVLGGDTVPSVPGWPSPFCRIANLPIKVTKPDFSAPGGVTDKAMRPFSGNATWNASARLEAVPGTSVAAPVIAREAAIALASLEMRCPPEARPFSATVRAVLMLGAEPPSAPPKPTLRLLFEKTLGLGLASAEPLLSPPGDKAWFIWQGELEGPGDITRISFPIPYGWLVKAGHPRARIVWAWDSPVNANDDDWTCRRVKCELRASMNPEGRYLLGSKDRVAAGTAWRTMDFSLALGAKQSSLRDEHKNKTEEDLTAWPEDGLWMLSLWYEEAAALPDNPRRTYSTRQRVGLALELVDDDGVESPQTHVQAHELSAALDRFAFPLQTPNTLVVPNRPR